MPNTGSSRIPLEENQFTGGHSAAFYDDHARRFMRPVYCRFANRATRLPVAGQRVLDIGTGTGLLPIELIRTHPDWRIIGIDISEEMLNLARESISKAGLSGKINFRQAGAGALPFPDNSFDIVLSNASLHLWKEPVKVFDEIARVTAPGGCFLLWDNLRVPAFYPIFGLIGRLMGMDQEQKGLWLKAIKSSYTAGESKALLKQSALKDARISVQFWLLELEICWRKA